MMVNHVASALADHWHSRAVSTVIVPVPPAEPIADGGALTATAHRSVVGPTTLVEEEDPLHAAINDSREHSSKRRQVRIRLLGANVDRLDPVERAREGCTGRDARRCGADGRPRKRLLDCNSIGGISS